MNKPVEPVQPEVPRPRDTNMGQLEAPSRALSKLKAAIRVAFPTMIFSYEWSTCVSMVLREPVSPERQLKYEKALLQYYTDVVEYHHQMAEYHRWLASQSQK